MRKKIFAALLGSMMLFIAGCGNDDLLVLTPNGDGIIVDDGTGTSSSTTPSPAEANDSTEAADNTESPSDDSSDNNSSSDLIRVGFAQVGSESGWRLAQTQSMKETFTEANGYQLDFVDCNNSQQTQIEAIETFIKNGVDYIVLDPIVETGYDDALTKAQTAGIPVIVVDRNISTDETLYTCWVGSDFTLEGESAALWLAEYLETNGRSSEEVNIVTILGSDGSSAMLGRTEGFNNIMAEHSNWVMLDSQSGDFTEDGGYAVMKAFIQQHSNIDVVICQNDDEAFGAITAMQESGLSFGPEGDIIVISFDATGSGFERMIAGEINVDIECNPLEGPLVDEIIQKLEKGETVDMIQYVEEGIYPAETAADIIDSRAY